mmetsp:Transcript_32892/g.72540  ORF Transcript_32892/g.72540 Transcript_32892/m.72540 type:complete len:225 (+) Transcript_32892:118-792(+)
MCISPVTRSRSDSTSSSSAASTTSSACADGASVISSDSFGCGGKKRVVILDSTPSSLLAAIYLLRRPGHSVTLLSSTIDIGLMTPQELSRNRGSMTGLSKSGLSAFHAIPNLWEKYIRPIEFEAMDFLPDDSGAMTIDENYLRWALSRYLRDNFVNKANLHKYQGSISDDDEDEEGEGSTEFVAHFGVKTNLDEKTKTVSYRQWYDEDEEEAEDTTVQYDLLMQ